MDFFKTILIFNYRTESLVCPYHVQTILTPFYRLYCWYSRHHSQLKQYNDVLFPKPDGQLSELLNVNSPDNRFNKNRKFIQTKIPAFLMQGFNQYLG
jgi:hypothetical protein